MFYCKIIYKVIFNFVFMDDIFLFNKKLEDKIREEFGEEASDEFINMLILGKSVYGVGYNDLIPLEKVQEWVENMYNCGKRQKELRNGEREGMIFVNSGDVVNAGAYLSLFGKKEGYLSR